MNEEKRRTSMWDESTTEKGKQIAACHSLTNSPLDLLFFSSPNQVCLVSTTSRASQ
jgi:hypothetical protein